MQWHGTDGDRIEISGLADPTPALHPLVAGLSASLENRDAFTIGTFAAQVHSIYAELMLMQSQIDQLAMVVDADRNSIPDTLLWRTPSDQEVVDLSTFLTSH